MDTCQIIVLIVSSYILGGLINAMVYDHNRHDIEGSKALSILYRIGVIFTPILTTVLILYGLFLVLVAFVKWLFKCKRDEYYY